MREMMRLNDRALGNLDAMPGDHAALRRSAHLAYVIFSFDCALARMYHDVQEPLMDAAFDSPFVSGSSGSSSSSAGSSSAAAPVSTTPNTSPLPNPWATQSAGTGMGG